MGHPNNKELSGSSNSLRMMTGMETEVKSQAGAEIIGECSGLTGTQGADKEEKERTQSNGSSFQAYRFLKEERRGNGEKEGQPTPSS